MDGFAQPVRRRAVEARAAATLSEAMKSRAR